MTATVRCGYTPGCRRRVAQLVEVTYPGGATVTTGYCARHWRATGLDRPVLSRDASARVSTYLDTLGREQQHGDWDDQLGARHDPSGRLCALAGRKAAGYEVDDYCRPCFEEATSAHAR